MAERNRFIDVVKGIGIILMVAGHSNCPGKSYIYLFHMPIFFVISGFLWKYSETNQRKNFKTFLIKKLLALYVPYILTNGIFLLLNNCFLDWGFYQLSDSIPVEIISANNILTVKKYSISDAAMEFLKIVLMAKSTPMGGATWFFKILFLINIIHYIVCVMKNRYKYLPIILMFVCVIGMLLVNDRSSILYRIMARLRILPLFGSYFGFLIGRILKESGIIKHLEKKSMILITASVLLIVVLNRFGYIELSEGHIEGFGFYLCALLCGVMLMYAIAKIMPLNISKVICYIGKNSRWIISLHFVCFKLVSLLYIKIYHTDQLLLASFPCIEADYLYIWYILTGVALPICIKFTLDVIKNMIKNRYLLHIT